MIKYFFLILIAAGKIFATSLPFTSFKKAISLKQNLKNNVSKNICNVELISKLEKQYNIPNGLLNAIAKVETSHNPWALNVRGKPCIFKTQKQALSFLLKLNSNNIKTANVGLFQIHYGVHSKFFDSIDAMLDPKTNAHYAACYLTSLKNRLGNWELAVKNYHSPLKKFQTIYWNKIQKALSAN